MDASSYQEPEVGSAWDALELPTGSGRVLDRQDCTPDGFRWLSLLKLQYEDHLGRRFGWEAVARQTRPRPGAAASPVTRDGGSSSGGVGGTGDGVAVFAKVVSRSGRTLVPVVVQFRPPLDCLVIELPAGLVEAGQSPEETAVRELREETGFSGRVTGAVSLPLAECAGITDSCCHLALVEVDGDAPENSPAAARPTPEVQAGELLVAELLPYDCLLDSLLGLRDRLMGEQGGQQQQGGQGHGEGEGEVPTVCGGGDPQQEQEQQGPQQEPQQPRGGCRRRVVIDSRLHALALGLHLGRGGGSASNAEGGGDVPLAAAAPATTPGGVEEAPEAAVEDAAAAGSPGVRQRSASTDTAPQQQQAPDAAADEAAAAGGCCRSLVATAHSRSGSDCSGLAAATGCQVSAAAAASASSSETGTAAAAAAADAAAASICTNRDGPPGGGHGGGSWREPAGGGSSGHVNAAVRSSMERPTPAERDPQQQRHQYPLRSRFFHATGTAAAAAAGGPSPTDWREAFREQLSGLSEGEIQAIFLDRDPEELENDMATWESADVSNASPCRHRPVGLQTSSSQPAPPLAAPSSSAAVEGMAVLNGGVDGDSGWFDRWVPAAAAVAAAAGSQAAAGGRETADDRRRARRRGRRQQRRGGGGGGGGCEGEGEGDADGDDGAPPQPAVLPLKRRGRSTVGGGGKMRGFAGSNAGPPPRRWGKPQKTYGLVAATSAARRLLDARGWVRWAASDPVALSCSALVCGVTLSAGGLLLRAWWRAELR